MKEKEKKKRILSKGKKKQQHKTRKFYFHFSLHLDIIKKKKYPRACALITQYTSQAIVSITFSDRAPYPPRKVVHPTK